MFDSIKQKQSISPLAAGVTGMVIGAAAVIVTNKNTREKTKQKAIQLKSDLQKWSAKKVKIIEHKKELVDDINRDVKQFDKN